MPAAALVTLAQAKAHIHVTTPPGDVDDPDLQLKLDQSEAIIRGYLKAKDDPTWTPSTVPGAVTACILLMFGALTEIRGAHEDPPNAEDQLWGRIDKQLSLYRDPALA